MSAIKDIVQVKQGDITRFSVDVIVNAANPSLMGGGGVDGAIHKAGGPAIIEECKEIVSKNGECETGEAVITTAGDLPAKHVIHTVGPIWKGGENQEKEKLYSAYFNSLMLAVAHKCRSIAFPNISTGVYGYPKKEAASVAVDAIFAFVSKMHYLDEVQLVCYDEENLEITREAVKARA